MPSRYRKIGFLSLSFAGSGRNSERSFFMIFLKGREVFQDLFRVPSDTFLVRVKINLSQIRALPSKPTTKGVESNDSAPHLLAKSMTYPPHLRVSPPKATTEGIETKFLIVCSINKGQVPYSPLLTRRRWLPPLVLLTEWVVSNSIIILARVASTRAVMHKLRGRLMAYKT